MSVQQSKLLKVSLTISIILHTTLLFSIVWMKLDGEHNASGKIDVTLLKDNKARLQQRSIPRRAISSFKVTFAQSLPETTIRIGMSQAPSPVTYVDRESPKLFSATDSMPYDIPQNTKVLYFNHDLITRPTMARLDNSIQKPSSLNNSMIGGYKFIDIIPLMLDKTKNNTAEDNSEVLQKFLDLIRKKIESKKKYPMFAKNAGVEGRSKVKIIILKDGQLEKVEIIVSSGSEILDDAALESVRNAVPFPPIPFNLGRDKIEMSIYLVFKIV